MNKFGKIFAVLIIIANIVALNSCKVPDEDIVFRGVKNLKLNKVDGSDVYLTAEAIFFNPNDIAMKLRKVDVELEVDGKKVAKVNQDQNVKIGANDNFTVPLDVKFDLKESGLLDNLFSLLGGKKYEIHYKGYIKASVYGVPFKAPVDHKEEMRLR